MFNRGGEGRWRGKGARAPTTCSSKGVACRWRRRMLRRRLSLTVTVTLKMDVLLLMVAVSQAGQKDAEALTRRKAST